MPLSVQEELLLKFQWVVVLLVSCRRLAKKLHKSSYTNMLTCLSNFPKLDLPRDDVTMRLTKETVVANLHLMKIHWLMIKLHIVKEFSSLMAKMHR